LVANTVYWILEDDDSHLWLSTSLGICSLDLEGLDRGSGDPLNQDAVVLYNERDGMPSAECNGGSTPAGCKTADGTLWFPTIKGLVGINPGTLNRTAPKAEVESVSINGELVYERHTTPQHLAQYGPEVEKMVFHFSAVSLLVPGKIKFKYMLEGVEDEWEYCDDRQDAYYNSLKPGEYCFKVIAANNDGFWQDAHQATNFRFRVLPAFYETWTFFLACFAVVALMAFGLHRLRMRHLKQKGIALQRLVDQRTQALKETNETLIQTQQELVEMAHQAGMAEIASSVMHNIGNVLNSVTISTQSLIQGIAYSPSHAFINKLLVNLEQNQDRMIQFLTEDVFGKKLGPVIPPLRRSLDQAHDHLLQELKKLHDNVEEIRDFLKDQEQYSHAGKIMEKTDLSALIENAIKVESANLAENGMTCQCELSNLPSVMIPKAKLMHVLAILIRNAIEASGNMPKELRALSIKSRHHAGSIIIEVTDQGCGIKKEDLEKVFNRGFSTKKQHSSGFGLHYSANSIREMGGALKAFSDGPNKGARFVIKLPVP